MPRAREVKDRCLRRHNSKQPPGEKSVNFITWKIGKLTEIGLILLAPATKPRHQMIVERCRKHSQKPSKHALN